MISHGILKKIAYAALNSLEISLRQAKQGARRSGCKKCLNPGKARKTTVCTDTLSSRQLLYKINNERE